MKKFEYEQLFLNVNDFEEVERVLNTFGKVGWEVFSVVDSPNIGSKDFKHFFLKRPLKIVKNEKT